jgi:glycosyltransferase involved in cell wall biosynthesis
MITVIIPTLNEEDAIGKVIDAIPRPDGEEMEILIVDGLSKDRTVEIARGKGARAAMEKRKGYGRAYKTGFRAARGDVIVTLDGDMTYPQENILEYVKMLRDGELDFISCDRLSRLEKGVMRTMHRFGNWVLKVTTNVLFGLRLKDSQTGMWVFRKEILEKLTLTSDGMPLSEEIKIEAFKHPDVKAKEISVPYRIREGDVKIESFGDGTKNLFFLFRKRFRKLIPDSTDDEDFEPEVLEPEE